MGTCSETDKKAPWPRRPHPGSLEAPWWCRAAGHQPQERQAASALRPAHVLANWICVFSGEDGSHLLQGPRHVLATSLSHGHRFRPLSPAPAPKPPCCPETPSGERLPAWRAEFKSQESRNKACARSSLPCAQMPPPTGKSGQAGPALLATLSGARLNPARAAKSGSCCGVTDGPTTSQFQAMDVYCLTWFLGVGLSQGPLGCRPGLWPLDGLTGNGGSPAMLAGS